MEGPHVGPTRRAHTTRMTTKLLTKVNVNNNRSLFHVLMASKLISKAASQRMRTDDPAVPFGLQVATPVCTYTTVPLCLNHPQSGVFD